MVRKIVALIVLTLFIGMAMPLFAQEQAAPEAQKTETKGEIAKKDFAPEVQKWIAIAAGFGIAVAAFGGALGQGRAISSALEGIARNPGATGKIFTPMIIGLALIESLVLYAFIIAILLFLKL
jgi:F-type H+-transporting ATPase subunit c